MSKKKSQRRRWLFAPNNAGSARAERDDYLLAALAGAAAGAAVPEAAGAAAEAAFDAAAAGAEAAAEAAGAAAEAGAEAAGAVSSFLPHAPRASAAITEANRSDFFICVLKGSDR